MTSAIELDVVSREAAALRAVGTPFVLATVVRVEGSSYRRPGARMLVADDRWWIGCVSGGCLEADVMRRAEFRTRGGPVVVRYDSTIDDDLGWGLGLGCNGVVDILLERVDASLEVGPTSFIRDCLDADTRGVIVTVFASEDQSIAVGSRLCLSSDDVVATSVPRGPVRDALAAEARAHLEAVRDHRGLARERRIAGVHALLEAIVPVPRLFVVGGGHDAVPVVELARSVGFRVVVADAHASFGLRSRFSGAERILVGPPETLARVVDECDTACVVIMTHDFERDARYLEALLPSRARYVGVLGPAQRTERLLSAIGKRADVDLAASRAQLHAPAGLDLGAETPCEIALAIVADVQATLTNGSAVPLRARPGRIHDL